MQFDFSTLTDTERYKLMSSAITPRPIAWLTTLSSSGVANAAPYSFFNMMGSDPPLVAIGLMRKRDGTYKDSARNILDMREFVVNLVNTADAGLMNLTAIDAPPEFDELSETGIATLPSIAIAPPRIASAPVSMECRLRESVELGQTTVVLGEVHWLHIADAFIDTANLHVDTPAL